MRPGPLRIALENRTDSRVLPTVFIAGHTLHDLLARRRPFLTAKRLLSNQTFRDLYRTDTLDVDQRLKITSLTFLFTDLRGSTELYERVGDLVAFDLVRAHFQVLHEIVASEAGAVVKTIGDAVMATFPTPDRAVAAALRMREAMRDLNSSNDREDLLLKIGVHEGPCIAVTLNERQDYFGSDGQHSLPRAGARQFAVDLRHRRRRRRQQDGRPPEKQGPDASVPKRLAEGHRARSAGLRHPLAGMAVQFARPCLRKAYWIRRPRNPAGRFRSAPTSSKPGLPARPRHPASMARIVMKFGGTSVADIGRIRNVARHVKREVDAGHEVAVVVSAMAGKTNELVGWVQGSIEGRGLQPQHLRCQGVRRRGRLGRTGDVGTAGARAAVDRRRRALLAGLADIGQDRQRAWRRAHPGDRRHDADRAVQDRPGGGHRRFPGPVDPTTASPRSAAAVPTPAPSPLPPR